jgi:hypothetical protein
MNITRIIRFNKHVTSAERHWAFKQWLIGLLNPMHGEPGTGQRIPLWEWLFLSIGQAK